MAHPNPWLDRRIVAFAHQGGAWESPSSTLFALRRAVAAGATAIELDVHATADGELVVCHDATVDRTTDGRGRIAELTLAELRALDNAYWFIPGADVTPGRPAADYPYRGGPPGTPSSALPPCARSSRPSPRWCSTSTSSRPPPPSPPTRTPWPACWPSSGGATT